MSARVIPIASGIPAATRVIREGGVVVLPTDTVYGLGVDPANDSAIRGLFDIKRRDGARPIPILLSDVSGLTDVCDEPPEFATRLAEDFLPGPLTLVVRLSAALPPALTAGRGTVGVRVPAHDDARAFIRACGGSLAVTSANFSGEPPATRVSELPEALAARVDLVLDGGTTPGGLASTVVDCSVTPPRILRAGPLTAAALGIEPPT
jgi:L-threonylcarbamoyladenylate synthase